MTINAEFLFTTDFTIGIRVPVAARGPFSEIIYLEVIRGASSGASDFIIISEITVSEVNPSQIDAAFFVNFSVLGDIPIGYTRTFEFSAVSGGGIRSDENLVIVIKDGRAPQGTYSIGEFAEIVDF